MTERHIFSANIHNHLVVFDKNTRLEYEQYNLDLGKNFVSSLHFKCDLLYAGSKGCLSVIDLNTKKVVQDIIAHSSWIKSIQSYNEELITASIDKTIKIWDLRRVDKPIRIVTFPTSIYSIKMTPDFLFVGTKSGQLICLNPFFPDPENSK